MPAVMQSCVSLLHLQTHYFPNMCRTPHFDLLPTLLSTLKSDLPEHPIPLVHTGMGLWYRKDLCKRYAFNAKSYWLVGLELSRCAAIMMFAQRSASISPSLLPIRLELCTRSRIGFWSGSKVSQAEQQTILANWPAFHNTFSTSWQDEGPTHVSISWH